MKKRYGVTAALAGLTLASAAVTAGLTSGASYAAGSATVTPSSGGQSTASNFETSGPCTDPAATNVYVAIAGGTAGGHLGPTNVVGNSPTATYTRNAAGGYVIPAPQSWHDFFTSHGISQPQGSYTVAVICRAAHDGTNLGSFSQSMQWANGAYSTGGVARAPSVTTAAHIKGKPKVGRKVSCAAAFSGATGVTYKWFRNRNTIAHAAKHTYKIPHSMKGKRLSCRATGKNAVGSKSSTSKQVKVRA